LTVSKAVAHFVSMSADRQFMIGPVVWQPSDGASAKRWYFTVVFANERKEVQIHSVVAEDGVDPHGMRTEFFQSLSQQNTPCVAHIFDDELEFIKWCEAAWPSDRLKRIREEMEADPVNG
jgi:hypothetical protein